VISPGSIVRVRDRMIRYHPEFKDKRYLVLRGDPDTGMYDLAELYLGRLGSTIWHSYDMAVELVDVLEQMYLCFTLLEK